MWLAQVVKAFLNYGLGAEVRLPPWSRLTKPSVLSTYHDQLAKKGPYPSSQANRRLVFFYFHLSFVFVGQQMKSYPAAQVRFSGRARGFSFFFLIFFHFHSFFSFLFLLGFVFVVGWVICFFVCLLNYQFIYFSRSQFNSFLVFFCLFSFSLFFEKTLHLFSVLCIAFILTGSFCVIQNILNKTEEVFAISITNSREVELHKIDYSQKWTICSPA